LRALKVVTAGESNKADVWGAKAQVDVGQCGFELPEHEKFHNFFPKNPAFLGIFWFKFLDKNTFLN